MSSTHRFKIYVSHEKLAAIVRKAKALGITPTSWVHLVIDRELEGGKLFETAQEGDQATIPPRHDGVRGRGGRP